MDTQKYNGWTNYETWNVSLWIGNILCYFASWIQEYVECYLEEVVDTDNIFVSDMIESTINDVDWHDIADHYVDDILDAVKDKELSAAWVTLVTA